MNGGVSSCAMASSARMRSSAVVSGIASAGSGVRGAIAARMRARASSTVSMAVSFSRSVSAYTYYYTAPEGSSLDAIDREVGECRLDAVVGGEHARAPGQRYAVRDLLLEEKCSVGEECQRFRGGV